MSLVDKLPENYSVHDVMKAAQDECWKIVTELRVAEGMLNQLPRMEGIAQAKNHVREARMWVHDAIAMSVEEMKGGLSGLETPFLKRP